MRVLVADALDPDAVGQLEAAGHSCEVAPGLSADDLPDHIAGYDVLVVRSTKVTAKTIESGDALSLVVRAGSGLNTIDRDAATAHGVAVANVPGANALAVAELTFGLLLALDRRIVDNADASRAGHWDKKGLSKGARGLAGSTIGVIGLGAIGRAVAERAVAFGMQVRTVGRPDASERTRAAIDRTRSMGPSHRTTFREPRVAHARKQTGRTLPGAPESTLRVPESHSAHSRNSNPSRNIAPCRRATSREPSAVLRHRRNCVHLVRNAPANARIRAPNHPCFPHPPRHARRPRRSVVMSASGKHEIGDP